MKKLLLILMCMPLMSVSAQAGKDQYYSIPDGEGKMYYREQGTGDVVLLMIHGLGSNSHAFEKLVEVADERYTTVVVDLPGYGKSEAGGFVAGMENYAALLADFVRHKNYGQVIALGHSMGAQIAMTAALQQGSETWLKGLFLMAPAGIETFSEQDRQWFSTYVTPEIMAAVPDAQLKANFDINFASGKLPEDAMFMYEERLALKEDATEFERYLKLVAANVQSMLQEPVFNTLPKIGQPVWLVYGKQDYLIPNKILHPSLTLDDLEKNVKLSHPESRFVTIDNAGHFLVWEQPDKLMSLLEEFMNANTSN